MPYPTAQQPDPARFPNEVLQRLRDLHEFQEAEMLSRRPIDLAAVHSALLELTAEVRQLRAAIQPTESPLIVGFEALREYRAMTTTYPTARKEHRP